MRFIEYVADKWVSVVIFVIVFICGGGLLMLIETPFAVACVVEGFYAAGFFSYPYSGLCSKKRLLRQAFRSDGRSGRDILSIGVSGGA